MIDPVAPQAFLNEHELTLRLRRLGVSTEQLKAMRFAWSNRSWPFEQWTVTWLDGTPQEAVPLIKAYSALKWLILVDPPGSPDKDAAWRLVSETVAAPIHALGLEFRRSQARRATKPRGKLSDGRTLGQIIAELASRPERHDESARELWPHLYDELDRLTLNPQETHDPKDPRRDAYIYDFGERRKRITFRQFANSISSFRTSQKSG
jgi:hypothetical protein